jgi:hypothetical protein
MNDGAIDQALFGFMADRGLFAACFTVLGVVLMASTLILFRLRFHGSGK